jgi:hypothetical protein
VTAIHLPIELSRDQTLFSTETPGGRSLIGGNRDILGARRRHLVRRPIEQILGAGMARCRLLMLVVLFTHLPEPGLAQSNQPAGTERQIAGVVRHAETRAPLRDVTVTADAHRTVSDGDGRFVLRVPAGVVTIEASARDFYPLAASIDVTLSDAADTELLLAPRSEFTATVDVVAAPPPAAAPSAVVVSPAQVLRTPGALDNVFRTLQTLPGVSPAEEFSSRLAVRGGAPDQNLTIMDSVEIHDPYRLFGLTSAFNPETISRFELATGGFSVRYGDRLSSLLVIESRAGTRRDGLNGSAALASPTPTSSSRAGCRRMALG